MTDWLREARQSLGIDGAEGLRRRLWLAFPAETSRRAAWERFVEKHGYRPLVLQRSHNILYAGPVREEKTSHG